MSDRTARARIRDAAIQLVADADALTARAVAERAGVSPGLIVHHYGSMDGLLTACDAHVVAVTRASKEDALDDLSKLDPIASLHDPQVRHLIPYLTRRLTSDSPAVDALVDHLIEDAVVYMGKAINSGALAASPDLRARATLMVIQSLGSLTLTRHLERHMGVDLTRLTDIGTTEVQRYIAATADLYSGILSPELISILTTPQGEQK